MDIPRIYHEDEDNPFDPLGLQVFSDLTKMLQVKDDIYAMFVTTFIAYELDNDFPFIARDFLRHIGDKLSAYADSIYAYDDVYNMPVSEAINRKILNVMLHAALDGDPYVVEMFREMYKTYYRKEYRAFKRFRKMSYHELESFETEEEVLAETEARILVMCEILGVETSQDCKMAYLDIHEAWTNNDLEYCQDIVPKELPKDLYAKCLEKADEILAARKDEIFEVYWDRRRFIEAVLRREGYADDWDLKGSRRTGAMRFRMAAVMALLKTTYPGRDFTEEEYRLYLMIYEVILASLDQAEMTDDTIEILLGRLSADGMLEEVQWKGVQKQPLPVQSRKKAAKAPENAAHAPVKEEKVSSDLDFLIKENERLRGQLKMNSQNLRNTQILYNEARRQLKENCTNAELAEDEHRELIALRDFVYHLSEEDIEAKEEDLSVMEMAIRKKRIVIVGGHVNWTSQLREKFPDWVFIKPGPAAANDPAVLQKADHVFFFTDTISHTTYGRFISAVREKQIPFGYIHRTNIKSNIQQVYRETRYP